MDEWIERIEKLLKDNGIGFKTSDNCINILNSSTMTKIKIFEYEYETVGKFVNIFVQEFDCFGNEICNKEFATLGKRFVDMVKRNILTV